MNKSIITLTFAAITVLASAVANADIVHLGNSRFGVDIWGEVDYQFNMVDPAGNQVSAFGTAGPILADSVTAGFTAPLALYCGDIHTSDSSAFNSTAGQAFQIVNLDIYGAAKAMMIQNLFDHVYGSIFEADGLFNENLSIAVQLALWEIIEETNETLNLNDGSFVGLVDDRWNTTGICIEIANDLLSSVQTSNWTGDFAETISREIFVFASLDADGNVNRDISQTMVGVAATPEPGTMMIFGIGLAGAALARRRMKKAH